MTTKSLLSPDYVAFVNDVKARIQSARVSAARAVNRDLILLYWDIGQAIVEKQEQLGWGESVVEMLAMQAAYPASTGFSARNLRSMKQFYAAYADPAIWLQAVAKIRDPEASNSSAAPNEFLQQAVAEIPWGHHLLILNKIEAGPARLYYLQATARFGWSRNVLLNQIKAQAYERAVLEKKTHNFAAALPEPCVPILNETIFSLN